MSYERNVRVLAQLFNGHSEQDVLEMRWVHPDEFLRLQEVTNRGNTGWYLHRQQWVCGEPSTYNVFNPTTTRYQGGITERYEGEWIYKSRLGKEYTQKHFVYAVADAYDELEPGAEADLLLPEMPAKPAIVHPLQAICEQLNTVASLPKTERRAILDEAGEPPFMGRPGSGTAKVCEVFKVRRILLNDEADNPTAT